MCACVRCAYCETRDERKSNSGSRTNVCHSLESLCLLCVMCAHEMALQPAWTSPNLNFQTVAHLYIIIMGMINHKKGKADVHRPIRYHTKREKRSECASLPSLPFSFIHTIRQKTKCDIYTRSRNRRHSQTISKTKTEMSERRPQNSRCVIQFE